MYTHTMRCSKNVRGGAHATHSADSNNSASGPGARQKTGPRTRTTIDRGRRAAVPMRARVCPSTTLTVSTLALWGV